MKKVILAVAVIIGFYSCHEEAETVSTQVTTSSYLPMTVGNFWVYQEYEAPLDGSFSASNILDSICISKDTLINGKTFCKFDSYQINSNLVQGNIKFLGSEYYKDSSKYLIDAKGKVLFSDDISTNLLSKRSDIFDGDTITWITSKMEKLDQIVNVPAGTFTDVLNVKGTLICNPKFSQIPNPRYLNKYFADNVGEILHSYTYIGGGGMIERRLIRYSIRHTINN
jgi:hypothetical protein